MLDIKSYIYTEKLKAIKKNFGSKCKLLANRISTNGERSIDVGLETKNGYSRFEFTMPRKISDITTTDYDRLEELIKEKL